MKRLLMSTNVVISQTINTSHECEGVGWKILSDALGISRLMIDGLAIVNLGK